MSTVFSSPTGCFQRYWRNGSGMRRQESSLSFFVEGGTPPPERSEDASGTRFEISLWMRDPSQTKCA